MLTSDITPLLITLNEAANIGRCLGRLTWAAEIVVVDSGSTDETLEICSGYDNVRIVHRAFDSFAAQCNFGLGQVCSGWVLSLDADYIVPESFVGEVAELPDDVAGYSARFRYCISGRPLRACLYPDRVVLYRVSSARYEDLGHGHRVRVSGATKKLKSMIDHDDRKSLRRWLDSQYRYASQEAEHLGASAHHELAKPDRIRKMVCPAAPLVFLYTLIWKGCLLDGRAGWFYVLQRTYAEVLLSLLLIQRHLSETDGDRNAG